MAKVAFVEVGTFHDECLYSQLLFFSESEHETYLICNEKIKDRVQGYPADHFLFLDFSEKKNKYKNWFKIRSFVIKNQISKVIFNTAESNIFKLILLPVPVKTQIIGIIHNTQKVKQNFKNKLIARRMHKIFVLAEFIEENVRKEHLFQKKLSHFYPIYFPKAKIFTPKPEGQKWISIPGIIDFNKRDYELLLQMEIPKDFTFILLGRPVGEKAYEFLEKIKMHPQTDQFIWFDEFVDNATFQNYMAQSDYVMPLIHPNIPQFGNFLKYKISGSYNLGFGYQKKLLMEQSFNHLNEFRKNTIFYNYLDFGKVFECIKNDHSLFEPLPEFNFETQKKKYLDFIFNK
jgi:hypothetical protein